MERATPVRTFSLTLARSTGKSTSRSSAAVSPRFAASSSFRSARYGVK
jgi:hypothetical protein